MESFFDHTYTLEALAQSWADRKVALRQEEEQEFCDMLYKSIRESILARRESIFEELKQVIGQASDRTQLKMELWSYRQTSFLQWIEEDYHGKLAALKELGDEWTISNVARTKEMRVIDVIRKTDIVARLSLLFGPNFVITDEPMSSKEVSGMWRTTRRSLMLYYYPEHNAALSWTPTYQNRRKAEEKYRDVALREEEPVLNAGDHSMSAHRRMELRQVLLGY